MRHAGRGKSSGIANQYDVFILKIFIDIDNLICESLLRLKLNHGNNGRWKFVPDLNWLFVCFYV